MSGPKFPLYRRLPGLVLGFHGCDASVGEKILRGEAKHLTHSENSYDWLGSGIYFWENDPQRALEFARKGHAKHKATKGHIAKPFVLGAVIDLGFCLNLLDRVALEELKEAHLTLLASYRTSTAPMPVNKGEGFGARFLDRAVVETLHEARAFLDAIDGGFPPYESVRAAFPEGERLYDGAGFQAENHIQIAILNVACIKGYFRPISE